MKRPTSAAARVATAQAELVCAERDFAKSTLSWQRQLQQHRGAITLIGGFSAGLALALLPPRWWARAGAVIGTTAANTARSALAPAIVGAVLSQLVRSEEAKRKPLPTSATG